jgi:addiction module HigA family antidote
LVLAEDFLKAMNLIASHLAHRIGVPSRHISEIAKGRRDINAETALRLGKFYGMEPQFWMNLQTHYDLEIATDKLADALGREVAVLRVTRASPRGGRL